MESALMLGLLGWGTWLLFEGRSAWSGVALGLATVTRPDIAFAVAALIVVRGLLTRSSRRSLVAFVLAGATGIAWVIVARTLAGGVWPSTLAAKVAQAASGLWRPYAAEVWLLLRDRQPSRVILGFVLMAAVAGVLLARQRVGLAIGATLIGLGGLYFLGHVPLRWLASWPRPVIALVVVGLVFSPRMKERSIAIPLIAAGVVSAATLSVLKVAYYSWYPMLPMYVALILAGIAIQNMVQAIRPAPPWPRAIALAAIATGISAAMVMGLSGLAHMAQTRVELRQNIGPWLRAETPATASVACMEIGILGYTSDRRIVDYLGILDSEAVPHIAQGDWTWWLGHYRPDYVVMYPAAIGWAPADAVVSLPWFAEVYRVIKQDPNVIIYQRIAPVPESP